MLNIYKYLYKYLIKIQYKNDIEIIIQISGLHARHANSNELDNEIRKDLKVYLGMSEHETIRVI